MDSLVRLEAILEGVQGGVDWDRKLRRLYARRPDLYAKLPMEEQRDHVPTLDDLDGSGYAKLIEWEFEVEAFRRGDYE